MKPLSVGNVVSTGLRIYRDNFKKYFKLAFFGYLWLCIPIIVIAIIGAIFVRFFGQGSIPLAISVLSVIAGILFFIYGCAKYSAMMGLISRLAFGEVAEKPEAIKDAQRYIRPKMWKFLVAGLLVSLIIFGAMIAYFIIFGIAGVLVGIVLGQNSAAIGITVLLVIAAILIFIFGFIWLISRLFLVELPLAVEENITAVNTFSRSWELTKGSVGRIQLILFVAFLISLPIGIAVQILTTILEFIIGDGVESFLGFAVIGRLLYLIIVIVSSALMIPFWQAIKAVIYYDLRVRREGMGMDLRKS